MQKNHKSTAAVLASVCPDLHDGRPGLDLLWTAADLLRVVHLAMRADDYHAERDVEAMADVTMTAVDLLDNARTLLTARPSVVAGEDGGADHAS